MGGALYPLLECVRRGEPGVINAFFRTLRERFLYLASRRMGGGWAEEWIEDVVQECLLDALRGLRGCTARSECEFKAWTSTILRRRVANFIRNEEPRVRSTAPQTAILQLPDTATGDPSPEVAALLPALSDALDDLSPSQSYLLWMPLLHLSTWRE